MKSLSIYISFLLTAGSCIAQQPIPAKPQSKSIAIKGATIHIGNGQVLENSSIVIQDGKIKSVGKTYVADEIIEAQGKHIYPGFIAMNSVLGLNEYEAVRATNDYEEVGEFNPNVHASVAYNTDSKVTPTVRFNGVMLAQVAPQGGVISGQSSVMELDGWNWEDAAYKLDEGVHLNWPNSTIWKAFWADSEEAQRERIDKNVEKIRSFFNEAKSYANQKGKKEINLRFEAMRGLFDGSKQLYIHANTAKEIMAAIDFSKSMNIRMTLVGAADAWLVAPAIKENQVSVILIQPHSLPRRTDDDVDMMYKLPALLQKEGVNYAIEVEGFWQQRNIPFNAGNAVAYGLSKEEALSAITLNAAKILGIDKTLGSVEVGKDATFILSTGDALDMRTNQIEKAFIRGKELELTSIQTALNKKYLDKYGIK